MSLEMINSPQLVYTRQGKMLKSHFFDVPILLLVMAEATDKNGNIFSADLTEHLGGFQIRSLSTWKITLKQK